VQKLTHVPLAIAILLVDKSGNRLLLASEAVTVELLKENA